MYILFGPVADRGDPIEDIGVVTQSWKSQSETWSLHFFSYILTL